MTGACPARVMGLDTSDGTVVFDKPLPNVPGGVPTVATQPRFSQDGSVMYVGADAFTTFDKSYLFAISLADCAPTTYCQGAPNSAGTVASIGWQGSISVGSNDLALSVSGCPPTELGIFIMGQFNAQSPFGDGWLCVSGGVHRLAPAVSLSTSGAGSLQLDLTDPNSPAALIAPDSDWQFQFWYRDPQAAGSGFNLSNGLSAHFCP